MANHSLPTLTSTYTNFLTELGARIDDAAKQGRSDTVTLTNPPVGMIRWNATSKLWEQNTGTVATPAWTALATTYGISITGDAATVDGKSFGTFTAAGGIMYATSTTGAAATAAGTSGQVLLSGAAGAPTWTNQSSLAVGSATTATSATSATTATNLAAGVAGAVPYQTGVGSTAFSAAGTSGQVLTSAGTAAPTWSAQSALSVGSATTATHLAAGSAGTLPYQSAAGTTAMLAAGTSGYILKANGAAAPSWVATSTIDAGTVDGKSLGTFTAAGGIAYASSTTALAATAAGTSGQALLSGGAAAPTWGTLSLGAGGTGATSAAQALINLGQRTSATGSNTTPVGTTAQRDASPATGYFRFNTTLGKFEGYTGTAWGSVGGGATGGGSDAVFHENGQTVTTDYTITSGKNAMSAGPITIASGITVTVPSGSEWTVV